MFIVTGALGFIGSAFVWELNKNGHTDIICCDIPDSAEGNANLKKLKYTKYVQADDLFETLREHADDIEAIVHMGACSDTTETDKEYIMSTNFEYTQKLWEWCSVRRKRLIYASSAAVYGSGKNGYDDQTDPLELKALNLYGESKLLFDQWVYDQTRTPPSWVGLRFFNVFGPQEYHKDHMASVVYKAFHQINQEGQMKLFRSLNADFEDGNQMRDFIYIKDVTNWLYQIATDNNISGIYNFGTGKARTWLDLAKSTFAALKKEPKIEWIDMPDNIRHQYQYFTQANMEALNSNGQFVTNWPLENAVDDYVNNYLLKEDPYL